jgi:putative redox protein
MGLAAPALAPGHYGFGCHPAGREAVSMSDSKPVVIETTGHGDYQVAISAQGPTFYADEPAELGGDASGPTPYELISGALGACTAMTMKMYARRKQLPLSKVQIAVSHHRDASSGRDHFERQIYLEGDLTAEQVGRLMDIAERCPVGKSLMQGSDISSQRVMSPPGHEHEPPRDRIHEPAMARACDEFERTG